jgi:uncharacterized membrane protein
MEDLEYKISLFLRRGVMFSACLLAVGLLGQLFFSDHGQSLFLYQNFKVVPFSNRIQTALMEKNWFSLFSCAGLVVLISLPMIRVALTGILFWKNKERTMSFMALLVFSILVLSLFLGIDFN